MEKKKKLLIIDAHALLHRAFHALPSLTSSRGEPIGGIYGFVSLLLKSIKDLSPDYIVACFDLPKPTLRQKKFPAYKAQRPKAPPELVRQFSLLRELLKGLEIPILEKEGYEADDTIGTVVQKITQNHPEIENIILTGDLDTLQLINRQTKVFTPRRGLSDSVIYDEEKFKERFGEIEPEMIIEYKGLKGDPSDNIPGVPGIGEKTALKLVSEFGSLENLYRALESKKGRERIKEKKLLSEALIKKLQDNKDLAFFSRELATIHKDLPLDFDLKKARWQPDPEKIRKIFMRFGFKTLYRRFLDLFASQKTEASSKKQQTKTAQSSLF